MTTPYQQQAYGQGTGTAPIPAFLFSTKDPTTADYNASMKLYMGWVNTITKALWYLEGVTFLNGHATPQWRAVGPIIVATTNPTTSDYQYPIGQTWINTSAQIYWGLVNITGTVASWEDLSGGTSTGILTLTGNSGGAVAGDGARNINIIGDMGVDVVGDPGTNTLTVSLTGGSQAIDSVAVDASTGPGTNPVLPDTSGEIFVTGGQIDAASTANVIRTNSLAANTYTVQIQRTTTAPSSNSNVNGVSHFNEDDFTVDNNGYVSALSHTFARLVEVDASTPPGTDPVVPDSVGTITVTGGQVAASTTTNVIRTASLAANAYTVQVQRSQAVGSSTVGDNGVCHFSSAHFAVDSNAFVTLVGGGQAIDSIGVQTGTNPIVPTVAGLVTINGATVAAGTHPVRTDGTGANTMAVEVQISQAIAATDATKIGLSNFNNTHFTVDANGFVSLIGGQKAIDTVAIQVFTSNGTYTPTSGMVYAVIEAIGGGAGGGGATTAGVSGSSVGGGGGAGEYARGVFSAATIGASKSVVIGAGGAGGVATTGSNGSATSVTAIISANGGSGGTTGAIAALDICAAGGAGGTGGTGGDFRSAGSGGYSGVNLGQNISCLMGQGGSSQYGSGGLAPTQQIPAGTGVTGANALGYGSGGSGAGSAGGGTANGGNGTSGIVVITEYIG